MQIKKTALILSIFCGAIIGVYYFNKPKQPQSLVQLDQAGTNLKLTTIYGTTDIHEPVLIELINSPAFERLKHIRQYGVVCHARANEPEYTRYQHSLGVFFLTRLYGAPLAEQIAALLHDVSHTVFSHVGDRLFDTNYYVAGNNSYQDNIHMWYLEKAGIMTILQKYDMAHACTEEAKVNQLCFEQPSPDLCADRIEYNITGGLIDGMISKDEVAAMLKSLHFENNQWYFDTNDQAKKFAQISVRLSEQRWGAAWSVFIDQCAAAALKHALELGIITHHDIHFSTDDMVWEKLSASSDQKILANIQRIKDYEDHFEVCEKSTDAVPLRGKFSGTNPMVKTASGFQRIRDIDEPLNTEFEQVKVAITNGYHAKLKITPNDGAIGQVGDVKFA